MQAFRYRITYAEENIYAPAYSGKEDPDRGGGISGFSSLFFFFFFFCSFLFPVAGTGEYRTVPRWLGVAWEKRKEQKEKGEGGGGASQAQMQGRGLKINGKWYHRKNKSHVKRVEHIPHIEGLGIRLVIYHSLLILTVGSPT